MINVLLINPPQKYFEKSQGFNVYFPIGLLSIAAMVKDICNIKILDCLVTDFQITEENDHLIYGAPFDKIKLRIKEFNPDIVGVTVPFSTQIGNAKKISEICKKINKNITVVFGGPDPSVRYEYILKDGACDYCVVREGEKTFFEFIKNFSSKSKLNKIEGLAYKQGGKIFLKHRKFLDNLDELPFPAYELINMDDYLKNKYLYVQRSFIYKKSISIITSRGCPFNCVFCSIKLHMGKKFRYNSTDYVIRHLEYIIEKFGIKKFHFEDDNMSLNKKRFEQILDKIIAKKLKIRWDVPNGLRADTLNFDLLKKIKRSGGNHLTIAIESGSQDVLDNIIKKKTSLDYILNVIKDCRKLRIKIQAFYVIGFPGETIEQMKETTNLAVRLLKDYQVLPSVGIASPLYGTELYKICVDQGLIKEKLTEKDFSCVTQVYGEPLISTKDFTKRDIKEIIYDFLKKLKRVMIMHAIRYPIFTLKGLFMVKDQPHVVKQFRKYKVGVK